MKSAAILNLILRLNASFLLGKHLHVDAVKVGMQISKDDTNKSTLRKSSHRMFQIVPVAKMENQSILLQQVDNAKAIKESFEDIMSQLEDVDFSVYPEFEGFHETMEYYQNETSKAVGDIIVIFENLEKEKTSTEYEISASSNMKENIHNQNEEDEGEGFFDNNNYKSQHEKMKSFHNQARHQAKTDGYDHFYDMHDALQNGDHVYLEKMMSSFTRDRTDDAESSTFDDQGRRKLSKVDQCEQLETCATGMTLYDLFVFFYSSLIDKSTGELTVSENFVRFDERDLSKKQSSIEASLLRYKLDPLYGTMNRDNSGEIDCDNLLSQFHQVIDIGGTPEWHGATVSKVCEATGTTDYVSLTGIMTGIRNLNAFYEEDTQTHLIDVIDKMVHEMLKCSADLFFSGKNLNKNKEKFIFIDSLKSSKDLGEMKHATNLALEQLKKTQFPFAVDVSTTGCKFVKLSYNLMKSSVTPRYTFKEATTFETCKNACCLKSWCKTFTCSGKKKRYRRL